MTRFTRLCKMAVLMAGIAGTQAAGLAHDDIDSACLLQLPVEDVPRNAPSAAEASAGARPVEEIAAEELKAMENIMGKELGAVEGIVENVVGKELDAMGESLGDIVDLKKIELGAVRREQGTKPAGPQGVEVPGPDGESPYPLVPPLASGAREEARGATTNGTRAAEHVLDRRVLGERDSPGPWGAAGAVDSLNLGAHSSTLRGFRNGFTDGTYGYAVPYSYGYRSGFLPRFDLAGFNTIEVLDLTATDPALKGFVGGFADGVYGYAMPFYNGAYSGKLPRFDLAGFNTVEVLDLTDTDPDLKGFRFGLTDGTYGYAIPHSNNGADYYGKVARFDLAGFNAVAVLDLMDTDTDLRGFRGGGFIDGTYGYVIPGPDGDPIGKLGRFDLAGFNTIQVLDLTTTDPALKGYFGGFTDGTYGYATPFINGRNFGFGKVVRFDLAGFNTIAVLDLMDTDPDLKGFRFGFTDGVYGYVIPIHNGQYFGKLPRFDLAGFNTVEVLDLEAADPDLKGFYGGFTDGTYGYAIPYWYNHHVAKVARFGVVKHVPLDTSVPQDTSAHDDQSSVVGDPHVVNVARARFDIRAEGVHKLVQLPRLIQANGKPDLRVDAEIQHLVGNDCSKSFMTSLSIFGRWTEDAAFGLMRISQGSDMPNTTLLINTQPPEEFFKQFPHPGAKAGRASVKFRLRDVDFHVGKHFEGRYGKQRAYLNVRIAGLKKYSDLGGLLGYDDHAGAEKLDVNCAAAEPGAAYQSSLIANERPVPTTTDGGSRIEAE